MLLDSKIHRLVDSFKHLLLLIINQEHLQQEQLAFKQVAHHLDSLINQGLLIHLHLDLDKK